MTKRTKNMKISTVADTDDGLYLWDVGDGKYIKNDNGDFLLMPSKKGDRYKLEKFKEYAHNILKDMGEVPRGRAVFLPGFRKVTDEQYEEQKARHAAGLNPDPFDVGAMQDEFNAMKKRGEL
jgi:hypothetical protein